MLTFEQNLLKYHDAFVQTGTNKCDRRRPLGRGGALKNLFFAVDISRVECQIGTLWIRIQFNSEQYLLRQNKWKQSSDKTRKGRLYFRNFEPLFGFFTFCQLSWFITLFVIIYGDESQQSDFISLQTTILEETA